MRRLHKIELGELIYKHLFDAVKNDIDSLNFMFTLNVKRNYVTEYSKSRLFILALQQEDFEAFEIWYLKETALKVYPAYMSK